ncbi:MAG: signal peptide peptidase SppA [Oscillospiraceae bacterium]
MKNKSVKTWVLVAAAGFAMVCVFAMASSLGSAVFSTGEIAASPPPEESYAIIKIYGTIQDNTTGTARQGYDHNALIEYIDELIEDEGNKGILLDVDSPGGTVYHSDEMYLKLMEYKEKTQRPIHAYFRSVAASGGYYIAGGTADYVSANRNCWTGSIGVIITATNLKGLYDKLGIQEVLITSGANKGMGSQGSQLTDEQRAIYQGLVDESYNTFVDIVAKARNLPIEKVKTIADGRVYTATQAVENGLVDAVGTYQEAQDKMKELTGVEGYEKQMYVPTVLEKYFAKLQEMMPKSDVQALSDSLSGELCGVPLYMYGIN